MVDHRLLCVNILLVQNETNVKDDSKAQLQQAMFNLPGAFNVLDQMKLGTPNARFHMN